MSTNMKDIKKNIQERIQSLDAIAELFYQQQDKKGMEELSAELPRLVTVIDEMYLYKQEHEEMQFKDTEIQEALQQMLSSMEQKDYILLADVIKYEIIEKFQAIADGIK